MVVVDVSGKGEQAGTRALLLSGAFGGLLERAAARRSSCAAANDYLLRQDWEEGFATAVHLSLDLATGDFELRTRRAPAGGPAPRRAPALGGAASPRGRSSGSSPDADFARSPGGCGRGDALLLYTDGMVETRGRDIALGIDRLLGQAERLLRGGFDGGRRRGWSTPLGSRNDDRALLLVHRR